MPGMIFPDWHYNIRLLVSEPKEMPGGAFPARHSAIATVFL